MNDLEPLWSMVVEGRLSDAETALEALVASYEQMSGPSSPHRWEQVANAEELLAGVLLVSGRKDEAIRHAQLAITRSRNFRTVANLIAAHALLEAGDVELARSKLELIVEFSKYRALSALVLAKLASLAPADPNIDAGKEPQDGTVLDGVSEPD
ncbi:MAG TPA: hypothetical protein VH561_13710 [Micromonosporaceae bacterium]